MQKEIVPKATEQIALLEGLQREPTNCVILLYSSGADSTATGLKLAEYGYTVHPVFIDYGQTASSAEEFLATIAPEHLGFESTHIIRMTDLMLSLTKSSLLGREVKDEKDAWIPARNTLFMLLAGIYAYQIDADGIAIGFIVEDQGVFGDSNIIHHKLKEALLTQTLSRPMNVFTPIMSMTKKDVLKYLLDKNALELTVSCWNAIIEGEVVVSCHECANCIERDKNLRSLAEELKDDLTTKEYDHLVSLTKH